MKSKMYSIRPATASATEGVTALLERSYPALMRTRYDPELLEGVLPVITQARPHLMESGSYYIATTVDGRTVGAGGWTREHPESGRREPGLAHIRHFAVDPGHVRRGIGRELFERCRAEALAAGFDRFECYSSLNAVPFYRSLGFEPQGEVSLQLGGGAVFPAMRMTAVLANG